MNSYALICPQTRQSVLIDPGDDPETLQEMLTDSTPLAILLTHSHPDHVGALATMRHQLAVPVYAHQGSPEPNGLPVTADHWLADGDLFKVGNHTLQVIYTPGHIGNQICFAIADDNRIIVGDTIFAGGPGKTWAPDGFQETLHTLRTIVLRWPDDSICYPGHGPSFRLGDKRAAVTAFLAKDHGDFYGDATWEM
jgi:glyoxylase-like metal-dependent hydrolase (beta-lactamase superfamily II)